MTQRTNRIFLLSPAHAGGKRAAMLTRPEATFELARQVQIGAATLGEVFAFCSGLYFRGKLAYSRHFATSLEGVRIISSSRGLLTAETLIGTAELGEFAAVPVVSSDLRYTGPLKESIETLAAASSCEFVLLGSIATGKYVDILYPILRERLLVPVEFAGRGDMSRGAMLLRAVAANKELKYKRVTI